MAININELMNRRFEEITHRFTKRDTILYALGIGLGQDPLDDAQLKFVYEKELVAMPTMAIVLASPGFWLKEPDTGVNWTEVLHVQQSVSIDKPLATEGVVAGNTRVTAIVDKGNKKGALIYHERVLSDPASGEHIAKITSISLARDDGGFSGAIGQTRQPRSIPDRDPDDYCDLVTLPQSALIYRLSGDKNPLHADPKIAAGAGFERPILHGSCSFGIACHAIIRSACNSDPHAVSHIETRFSAPVFPGETLRTEIWREGDNIHFRSLALERDQTVLDNGFAKIDLLVA